MQTDEILTRLIDRVDGRYFGKYRGFVSDNDDPDNLGRIRATIPRLLGEAESGWALPAFAYGGAAEQGLFAVPDVGAGVWIEFEGGDLSYPIWTGTWYTSGAIPEGATPGKKVFKTKSKHKIVLDDDEGTLEITDSNGNSIKMDAGVVKISTGSALKLVIEAPKIELVEDSTHPAVFGDDLLQYLQQIVQAYQFHTHPGETCLGIPVSPAFPVPVFNPPPPSMLSLKVTTG